MRVAALLFFYLVILLSLPIIGVLLPLLLPLIPHVHAPPRGYCYCRHFPAFPAHPVPPVARPFIYSFIQQLVALGTCYAVLTAITMRLNETHQALMDIRALLSLRAAKAYDSLGFWRSSTEEGGCKHQRYATDVGRLERLWDGALEEATRTRSFDTLVAHLKVNHDDVQPVLPPPINWRFNMIPYGADNPDAHTFPTAKADKPLKSFALNFTYNNMANWGDYVDRRDNKAAALRPARQMFTDVMIPGTK
eukprot:GHVU01012701.1.p1 GENE.GHVU01012701.1~~GHVU01012701.1.p1  ORF type:complete len:249 (-),score=37.91 GHVU01012701.1:384-1130(-)